jgi:hypothetical protein
VKRGLVLTIAALFPLGKLSACASCFGKTDAPLAQGMNAGIFVMLAFVILAWVAFGSFFVFIARRARQTEESVAESTDKSGNPSPSSH